MDPTTNNLWQSSPVPMNFEANTFPVPQSATTTTTQSSNSQSQDPSGGDLTQQSSFDGPFMGVGSPQPGGGISGWGTMGNNPVGKMDPSWRAGDTFKMQ